MRLRAHILISGFFMLLKANNNLAILNILRQEGAGFDVSCPAEIELALKAGAKPDEMLYSRC